jgi:serrate RNA effector molecule
MPQDPMSDLRIPCIKTISTVIPRTQLEALVEDLPGFRYLSVSDPNFNKKFARVGWVIVNEPGDPDEIVRILDAQRIHDDIHGDFTVHCTIHSASKEAPRKALPDTYSTREGLTKDLRLVGLLAEQKFEKEMGEGYSGLARIRERVNKIMAGTKKPVEEDDEGAVKEEAVPDSLAEIKKLLDLIIEYFRRVYSFCFYCCSENDSVYELQRKCYAGHFRRPPPESPIESKCTPSSIQANSASKQWLDKINMVINPPQEADILKLGGINVAESKEKEISSAISKEAEDRWRCTVKKCTKLFLEEKFVRSHIEKRHKDWLERIALEVCFLLWGC